LEDVVWNFLGGLLRLPLRTLLRVAVHVLRREVLREGAFVVLVPEATAVRDGARGDCNSKQRAEKGTSVDTGE
jgi:hypothetical protein